MSQPLRTADLEAYLDEALAAEEMARIEQAIRRQPQLVAQLAALCAQRDAGVHSLGAIWRRHRLSCPTREQLGSFLLGALDDGLTGYVGFHLDVIGCRYCQANLADLKNRQVEQLEAAETRRRSYFQSSAGLLRRKC
jgi:hypothetical protein